MIAKQVLQCIVEATFCMLVLSVIPFFFSSRRRHTSCGRDWSSDVCSSDLVHAFASDPERGSFLLMLLSITVLGSLMLYAFRAPVVHVRSRYGSLSREIFLLLNKIGRASCRERV